MTDQSNAAKNRRPIASRGWSIFQLAAKSLANAGVTPNAISTSSILFGILAGGAFATTRFAETAMLQSAAWISAALFIQLRLAANLLDGLVAVEGGKKTPTGELFNEVPDRISDTSILVGAGFAAGSIAWLGAAASIAALFVAYVRAIGASIGIGQVFAGPMAKQHRMAILTVTAVYSAIPMAPQPNRFGMIAVALAIITAGSLLTSIRRLKIISSRVREETLS